MLGAKVDELSARAAEIKAQRAEQDASTQAHLQARRDAEATPEPTAGPAGDFELEAYAGQAKTRPATGDQVFGLAPSPGWP